MPRYEACAANRSNRGEQETAAPSSVTRPTTLIIGLGSTLRGDDGVGVRVVEALAERALPTDVEVVDGGAEGLGIISLLEGRQRVVFVDAADAGQAPGRFVRFTFDDVRSGSVRMVGDEHSIAIHDAGLRDALLLAQALDCMPEEVIIFGVQPANLDWKDGLSPQVEAVLPRLVEAVLAEVRENTQNYSGSYLAPVH